MIEYFKGLESIIIKQNYNFPKIKNNIKINIQYIYGVKNFMDIISLGWGCFLAVFTFSIAIVIWGRNGF